MGSGGVSALPKIAVFGFYARGCIMPLSPRYCVAKIQRRRRPDRPHCTLVCAAFACIPVLGQCTRRRPVTRPLKTTAISDLNADAIVATQATLQDSYVAGRRATTVWFDRPVQTDAAALRRFYFVFTAVLRPHT